MEGADYIGPNETSESTDAVVERRRGYGLKSACVSGGLTTTSSNSNASNTRCGVCVVTRNGTSTPSTRRRFANDITVETLPLGKYDNRSGIIDGCSNTSRASNDGPETSTATVSSNALSPVDRIASLASGIGYTTVPSMKRVKNARSRDCFGDAPIV